MLIVGDLASHEESSLSHVDDLCVEEDEFILINLEGSLVNDSEKDLLSSENIVFNSRSILDNIPNKLIPILGLSNNHLFDDLD